MDIVNIALPPATSHLQGAAPVAGAPPGPRLVLAVTDLSAGRPAPYQHQAASPYARRRSAGQMSFSTAPRADERQGSPGLVLGAVAGVGVACCGLPLTVLLISSGVAFRSLNGQVGLTMAVSAGLTAAALGTCRRGPLGPRQELGGSRSRSNWGRTVVSGSNVVL